MIAQSRLLAPHPYLRGVTLTQLVFTYLSCCEFSACHTLQDTILVFSCSMR